MSKDAVNLTSENNFSSGNSTSVVFLQCEYAFNKFKCILFEKINLENITIFRIDLSLSGCSFSLQQYRLQMHIAIKCISTSNAYCLLNIKLSAIFMSQFQNCKTFCKARGFIQ